MPLATRAHAQSDGGGSDSYRCVVPADSGSEVFAHPGLGAGILVLEFHRRDALIEIRTSANRSGQQTFRQRPNEPDTSIVVVVNSQAGTVALEIGAVRFCDLEGTHELFIGPRPSAN
jgi:hypothetical protein